MTTSTLTPAVPVRQDFHPADVAARLDGLVSERTVPAEFLDTARARLDQVALRWKEGTSWRTLTWSEYSDRVARVAGGLGELGIGPSDRVVLLLPNGPEFHIVDMAAMAIGATPVSIYSTSSAEQIDHIVDDTDARLAIVHDSLVARALSSDAIGNGRIPMVVVGDDPTSTSSLLTFEDLLGADPIDLDAAITDLDPDGTATIIYTSGTTGPSKGVVLSHRNVLWATQSLRLLMGDLDLTGKRIVSYLPMAHIAERSTSHYGSAVSGYQITSCPDPNRLAEHLLETRPHLVFGVPRVWEKLRAGVEAVLAADPERAAKFDDAIATAIPIVRAIDAGTADDEQRATLEFLDLVAFSPVRDALGLDEVELAVTGAAPLPPETLEWFRAIGVPLSEIYGMSETAGPIAWTPNDVRAGTVGPVIPGAELRLADDGEILYRGGNVFVGYHGRPEATAEAIDADGWLHTGDIGVLDDGHLRIVDRKKELIVTAGGKNVSPANLEAAMRAIPLISQAIAVGDGRPFVAALVTLDHEALGAWAAARGLGIDDISRLRRDPEVMADVVREVESAIDRQMERFSKAERVREVVVLDDVWEPGSELLTPTLKLRRRAIHERYEDVIDGLYR